MRSVAACKGMQICADGAFDLFSIPPLPVMINFAHLSIMGMLTCIYVSVGNGGEEGSREYLTAWVSRFLPTSLCVPL